MTTTVTLKAVWNKRKEFPERVEMPPNLEGRWDKLYGEVHVCGEAAAIECSPEGEVGAASGGDGCADGGCGDSGRGRAIDGGAQRRACRLVVSTAAACRQPWR